MTNPNSPGTIHGYEEVEVKVEAFTHDTKFSGKGVISVV